MPYMRYRMSSDAIISLHAAYKTLYDEMEVHKRNASMWESRSSYYEGQLTNRSDTSLYWAAKYSATNAKLKEAIELIDILRKEHSSLCGTIESSIRCIKESHSAIEKTLDTESRIVQALSPKRYIKR
jgi:hypothetical protein